jgi:hypothetical protein
MLCNVVETGLGVSRSGVLYVLSRGCSGTAQPSHGAQNPRTLVLWCAVFHLRNGYTILSAGKVRKRDEIWSNLVFTRYSEVSSSYVARQMIAYSGPDAVSSSRASLTEKSGGKPDSLYG